MKTVISVSGGRTSAYIAANYECDSLVFALVRTENKNCTYPDPKVRQYVSDRLQIDFVGTLEDNIIIHTLLDLEQYIGKKIDWVTGDTFEEVCRTGGGILPQKQKRYCTSELKIKPIFYWWAKKYAMQPVEMCIGYRANELSRISTMIESCNSDGLTTYKATFEKNNRGQNKWVNIAWRKPLFPLYEDGIFSDAIHKFWENKPVRFADYNNCVGCFNRSPDFLRLMYENHPNQFNAFVDIEQNFDKGTFKENISYEKIKKRHLQPMLFLDAFKCSDGFCEP